jgi:predicted NAD/FAD-binding protein
VIGGGIGGCSCAYSLAQSGYDVTLYESRDQLGGNAQTATFTVDSGGNQVQVKQDLSVLYWAPEFYRNYSALLSTLGLEPAEVQLPYVVRATNASGQVEYYAQPGSESGLDKTLRPSMSARFAQDLDRYERMIGVIGRVSDLFHWGSSRPSFYRTNMYSLLPFANPFNHVGMKTCAHMFGMSSEFFETIVRPFHGLNLTTTLLDDVPATSYSVLDAISPLCKTRKVMTFGAYTSQEVFKRSTTKCSVKLGTRVRQVHCVAPGRTARDWQQVVVDDGGASSTFDRVVFACPASAAANILRSSSWMERSLLQGVGYHDELQHSDWRDWLEVEVHQDLGCLPADNRDTILKDVAFLIDVDPNGRDGGGVNVEYTCNYGSYSPAARAANANPSQSPMFMTQCPHTHRDFDPNSIRGAFTAPRSHPNLSQINMMITQFLHLVQGRRGIYYCSNWTSPGNGHDLACTSGLAVASAIGAEYPLGCTEARRDHRDCRRFMCI